MRSAHRVLGCCALAFAVPLPCHLLPPSHGCCPSPHTTDTRPSLQTLRTNQNRGMALQTPSTSHSHPVPSPLLFRTVAGSPLLTQTCSPRCTYRISRHRARRAGAGMASRPQPLLTPTAALGPPQRCPVCPQASSNRFWRKILSWLCRTAYGREGELGGVLQSCSTRRRSPINLPQ